MVTLIYISLNQSGVPVMIKEETLGLCIEAFNAVSFSSFESLFSEDEDSFIAFDGKGVYKKIEKGFYIS